MKKTSHTINLIGCDDETEFTMDLTDDEYDFLVKVAKKANQTSLYGCMPVLAIDDILFGKEEK